jgi:hypothetical protein
MSTQGKQRDDKEGFAKKVREIFTLFSKKNIIKYGYLNTITEYIINEVSNPIGLNDEQKNTLKIIFGNDQGSMFPEIGHYQYMYNILKQYFISAIVIYKPDEIEDSIETCNKLIEKIDLILASKIITYNFDRKEIINMATEPDNLLQTKIDELKENKYLDETTGILLNSLIMAFNPTTFITDLLK